MFDLGDDICILGRATHALEEIRTKCVARQNQTVDVVAGENTIKASISGQCADTTHLYSLDFGLSWMDL